jgi:hypothetical protein
MKTMRLDLISATMIFTGAQLLAQGTPNSQASSPPDGSSNKWDFSLKLDTFVVPHDRSFVNPNFSADHGKLHLEGRYNYEGLETGSAWLGYNLSTGKEVVFEATPMVGGVFGDTNGIAPGYLATLSYKKLELYSQGEYVFDLQDKTGNFFYNWAEVSYAPKDWIRGGIVAQRTRAYQTSLDIQRGILVGLSYKKVSFTTYVFNWGWTDPTLVFEIGVDF